MSASNHQPLPALGNTDPPTPSTVQGSSPIIPTPGDASSVSYSDSEDYDSDASSLPANIEFDADAEAAIPLQTLGKPKKKKRKDKGKGIAKHSQNLSDDEFSNEGGRRIRWSNDGGTPLPAHLRAAARETGGSEFFWSAATEKKIVRRIDKYLVGFVAVLYTLGFLDRSNIGNARLAGLEVDLQLTPSQWEWSLTAFYLAYIAFEWTTLLWRIYPPRKYVAICVGMWGLFACLQAVSMSFYFLVIMRFFLGVFEAAFSPGVPFYLSFFYRPEELAFRVGLFIAAAPLATAYAGALAWLITSIPGPIRPWRTLFIVEGFPTLVMACIAWYWVPDRPDDCWWLNWEERKIARRRLLVVGEEEEPSRGLSVPEILRSLIDPKNWIMAAMFFAVNVCFASLPIFMPTIIHTYGFSKLASQALSAPPYLLAFFAILGVTYLSDRAQKRAPFLIGLGTVGSACYALLSAPLPNTAKYILLYPLTISLFCCVALLIPWNLNTSHSASSKGAGMVLLQFVGQCGPLLGTRIYPTSDGPAYEWGMKVCSGALGAVAIGAVIVRWIVKRRGGMV